jgi:catechol 2,3-dioxygenase-like lactoylglutathione lyase family enzyme
VSRLSRDRPSVTQVALCTTDLPSTIKRLVEIFHFADAGGDVLWGHWLGQLQDAGDEAICSIWWLCSRQSFFQVELFEHKVPKAKPLAARRRACDVGWTRLGISVPDFDATLERLGRFGIPTITEPVSFGGSRRVCFRDPDVGAIVEIIEEGGAGAPQMREFDVAPIVSYAALSLTDMALGRRFFGDVLGMPEVDPALLHTAEMEALWGLEGASREIAVFDGGGVAIELCAYSDPTPQALPDDAQIVDLGLSHVGFGLRDRADFGAMVERLEAAGSTFTTTLGDGPTSTYLYGPERTPVEIMSFPQNLDPDYGFAPREVKLRPPSW